MNKNSEPWRTWPLSQLEREYSPSSCVESIQPYLAAYRERSNETVAKFACRRDLHWGRRDREVFDLFPAASPQSPLLIFIHGGYWQELSKNDSLFIAPGCLANGISFAAIEYSLAPQATVAEIVDECRRAVASIIEQAPALGFDPKRVFVAGSSAGAHLAAMLFTGAEMPSQKSRAAAIAGAILLGGIYDLTPLVRTYVNGPLKLTEIEAATLSPLTQPLGVPLPVIVAWGANETSEFKRQSQEFASKLQNARFPVKSLELAGANHFDILFEVANRNNALGRDTLSLIAAGKLSP
jgi:arylformamidase